MSGIRVGDTFCSMYYSLFLLFFIVTHSHVFGSAVIPAALQVNVDTTISYVCWIYIGTPAIIMKLEVIFNQELLTTYKNPATYSSTWSIRDGGSDFVYLGSTRYRLPIVSIPTPSDLKCTNCEGTIGFGEASILWKMFRTITFSQGTITLGALHSLYASQKHKSTVIICQDKSSVLCTFEARLRFDNYSWPVMVDLTTDHETIMLPASIYTLYMQGKNVYADDLTHWHPISIDFNSIHDDLSLSAKSVISHLDIPLHPKDETFTVSLDTYMTLDGVFLSKHKVIIEQASNERSVVTIGNTFWKNYVFWKDSAQNLGVLKFHLTTGHFSNENIILVTVLFFLLLRWTLIDATRLFSPSIHVDYLRHINAFFELSGIAITVILFFLDNNFDLLNETFWLQISIGVILGIMIICSIMINIYSIVYMPDRAQTPLDHFKDQFRINFVRNVTYRYIITTGIWIGLAERQTEGLATIYAVIINFYIIYSLTYYLVYALVYFILFSGFTSGDTPVWFIVFTVLITPGVYGFQLFITYYQFARPFLENNMQLYNDVIYSIITMIYLISIIGGFALAMLYFNYAYKKYLRELLKQDMPSQIKKTMKNLSDRSILIKDTKLKMGSTPLTFTLDTAAEQLRHRIRNKVF